MNRAQKREFMKRAKQKGIGEDYAKAYITAIESGMMVDEQAEQIKISDGDKVSLDVEKIKKRKEYANMSQPYKDFVESSVGVKFTANIEKGFFVSFTENPTWLFWHEDLILHKEE